jgi:hypothetical protein
MTQADDLPAGAKTHPSLLAGDTGGVTETYD